MIQIQDAYGWNVAKTIEFILVSLGVEYEATFHSL